MAQQTQYAYADESFRRIVISENELHMRGTFSGTTSYVTRDAISYGSSLYVALIAVSGTAPEGNQSDFWSILSVVQQGPPNPDDALAKEVAQAQFTADSAISGANFGIALGVAGTNLAQAAYDYALQGTSAAAALALAQSGTAGADFAIFLASQGTNGVNQLYPVATSGTAGANQAYQLASLGTNLAELALSWLGTLSPIDQGARDVAYSGTAGVEQLYPIATAGTAGVNQLYPIANSGTAGANQAFFLAAQGTNGANFGILLASAGTDLANYAIMLASAGTTGATNANALALQAYLLGINGTNAISQLYPIATAGTAGVGQALYIAESGTSGANAAYSLAQVGTNLNAYVLTWLGTTLGLVGTGTANVFVSQIQGGDRADLKVTVQNGVITSFGSSLYSMENFQFYAQGNIGFNLGELGYMSFWFGTASINGWTAPSNADRAFVSVDTMQTYGLGTVASPALLSAGTYWGAAWQSGSFAWNLTQDPLTSYITGTATPGQISGGTNWQTAGAFI